jgi:predicted RNA methylase
MIRQGVSDAKTDTVYLVDFDRTLTQIVSRMQAANASKDAVEIVRCGMQFRRAQLEAMAEREGRKNLVERLYREAIDEEKRKPGMN